MKRIFICEICTTPLGTVEFDELDIPMLPVMFYSLAPENGIPVPFQPFMDWSLFRCRKCKHRPFKTPDHITYLDERGFPHQIAIAKINIETKTREANQAAIDTFFDDEPEEIETSKRGFLDIFKSKDGFVCKKCGKSYQHQSSLARHEKVCK